MINDQILRTRIVIAKAANEPPDDVSVTMYAPCIKDVLFEIEYHGFILVLGGFKKDSTIEQARNIIEDLYFMVSSGYHDCLNEEEEEQEQEREEDDSI